MSSIEDSLEYNSDSDSDVWFGPITKQEIVKQLNYHDLQTSELLDPLESYKDSDELNATLISYYSEIITGQSTCEDTEFNITDVYETVDRSPARMKEKLKHTPSISLDDFMKEIQEIETTEEAWLSPIKKLEQKDTEEESYQEIASSTQSSIEEDDTQYNDTLADIEMLMNQGRDYIIQDYISVNSSLAKTPHSERKSPISERNVNDTPLFEGGTPNSESSTKLPISERNTKLFVKGSPLFEAATPKSERSTKLRATPLSESNTKLFEKHSLLSEHVTPYSERSTKLCGTPLSESNTKLFEKYSLLSDHVTPYSERSTKLCGTPLSERFAKLSEKSLLLSELDTPNSERRTKLRGTPLSERNTKFFEKSSPFSEHDTAYYERSDKPSQKGTPFANGGTPYAERGTQILKPHFKVPTKATFTKQSPKFNNIVSPIAMYINNNPKVPLVKNVVSKSVAYGPITKSNKQLFGNQPIAPQLVAKQFLPVRSYKPASHNMFMSKENEIPLPGNIRKLIKGPLNPEVVKHVGRIKATNKYAGVASPNPIAATDMTFLSSSTASEGIFNVSTGPPGDISVLVSKSAARTNSLQHLNS